MMAVAALLVAVIVFNDIDSTNTVKGQVVKEHVYICDPADYPGESCNV